MFAIVDIETTGGNPLYAGITEICAVITDGAKVVQVYETLLNPGYTIPRNITALTGISQEMTEKAPVFAEIAAQLHHLLHDKIFVAHNVNFDLGFIQNEFSKAGFSFHPPKLCTVKLSRKAFPGRRSYSLGNICSNLGIGIQNRHRAGGDAFATGELFHQCLNQLGHAEVLKMAKSTRRKITVPPALSEDEINNLPDAAGVYFFRDQNGKILYTGKANNIQKRVRQHFDVKRGKTALQLERIHKIDYQLCGNELLSLLTEAHVIHTYWPEWNVSGKHVGNRYAIYRFPTQSGYQRLQTEKFRKGSLSGIPFPRFRDAKQILGKMLHEYDICPVLARSHGRCYVPGCYCENPSDKSIATHNQRVEEAMMNLQEQKNRLLVKGEGRKTGEKALILIENGAVAGWGFADEHKSEKELISCIEPKPDIPETRAIIAGFLRQAKTENKIPYQIISLN
ncbi:MAG: exonuclease domain-containing protein [Sphingomonadales bacterium]